MGNRKIERVFCIILILVVALATLGAAEEQAWYVGKKIASFSNIGLQNVDRIPSLTYSTLHRQAIQR